MPFTIDDVIAAARDRTGNKQNVIQGELYVTDDAIRAGLRDAITACNGAFGESSGRKDAFFTTTFGPTLAPPPAPTLVASTASGTLPGGTYQYVVTSLLGTGETLPSGEAASPAVLAAPGNVTISWNAVQYASGYRVYGRTSGVEQLLMQLPAGTTTWTDTGIAQLASGLPTKNSTGGNGYYQQDYDVATYIGTDVQEILDVARSDAYVSESTIQPLQIDPRTGIPTARAAFIDQAYQQNALDIIAAQERWRKDYSFDWEVVSSGTGAEILRLMPPPTEPVTVWVRYLSTTQATTTLPDEARVAMEYAACYVILDGVLDRINSNPLVASVSDERNLRAWIDVVVKQRDRYEAKYRAALNEAPEA
jgi:hypothetical protein